MKRFIIIGLAPLLGACATTTSTSGVSRDSAGGYYVVSGGTTYDIPAGIPVNSTGTTMDLSVAASSPVKGFGASTSSVTLAAGAQSGTFFTGIAGTPSTSLPASTATYTGLFGVLLNTNTRWAAIDLNADFGAGTLTGGSPISLVIDGRISGSSVSGTATYAGTDSGALSGGFYGTGSPTVALTFLGANIAGMVIAN